MITEIEIGGYRLLDEFKADLTPTTVVIGANAVGKSTLIDCLQLIGECCEVPLNTAMGWHHGAASMLSSGNVNRQLTWNITFHHPTLSDILHLDAEKSLIYEVVLVPDTQNQMYSRYEVLKNQVPAPGHKEPFKFLEATPYRQQIFDRRQGKFTTFDEAQSSTEIVRESIPERLPTRAFRHRPRNKKWPCCFRRLGFSTSFPFLLWCGFCWHIWRSIRASM